MGYSSTELIKVGILTPPNKSMNHITSYLNSRSDTIVIIKADTIEKFTHKSLHTSNLNLLVVCEQPDDCTINAPLYTLRRMYPNSKILYISRNESMNHIIWALESGVDAYIPPLDFKFYFEKHFYSLMNQENLLLPPLFELKIALHYYPPTEEPYLDFGLTQPEIKFIEYLYQGLSLNEIATQFKPKKSLKSITQMVNRLCNKIDVRNSISII